MIRLGKLTDYGLVLMTRMAREHDRSTHSARDLALETGVPLPTVTKLLKELLKSGLLTSHRGASGGYALARHPKEISVAEIISALEGTITLTDCETEVAGLCQIEGSCPVRSNLRVISQAVRNALENVMLSDLARPLDLVAVRNIYGTNVTDSTRTL